MINKFKVSDFFDKSKIKQDNEFSVLGLIDQYPDKMMLTFLENEKYIEKFLKNKSINCVITNMEIANKLSQKLDMGIVIDDSPKLAFFRLHNKLANNPIYNRKSFPTTFGKNCNISKMSVICEKNVIIGNNVIVEDFVSIKNNVIIGDNSIIRSGSIIGGSGFEFKKNNKGYFRIEHLGGVNIGKNVEIQYNCTIDKALYPWDDTIIGNYSKFDNLVHIGHAVKIGKNVLFPAGSTVSGRVEINDNVWIGVGSVISNGVHFGKDSRCNIGAVVTKNVNEGGSVSGNFAIDHKKYLEHIKKIR
ncbi:MAG: UDP-3-O-(3-hydroxymyristoyl)glucosamine N-acyltransferase [Erysipelotrichaceae bacterium]